MSPVKKRPGIPGISGTAGHPGRRDTRDAGIYHQNHGNITVSDTKPKEGIIMDRKDRINPKDLNILCGRHKQYASQYTQSAPPLKPESEEKGFWGWLGDKARGFCEKVSEWLVPVVSAVAGVTAFVKACSVLKKECRKYGKESDKKKSKKNCKKSIRQSHATRPMYNIINIGAVVLI
jgi:hypothetical protein